MDNVKEKYTKTTIPLVSIVIATYNGEKFLKEQLESLVNQTYKNCEIIAIDDNSSDNTVNILHEYAAKYSEFRVVQNEKNLGYVKNFEKGFSFTKGDFIAPCDQDDVWLPTKIEVLLNHIDDCAIAYCNSEFIDSAGNTLNQKMSDIKTLTDFDNPLMYIEVGISALGHAMLIRKDVVDTAMPFPTLFSHDNWLGFVASFNGSVKFIDDVLVQYRRHDMNLTNALHKKDRKKNIKKRNRQERLMNAYQCLDAMYAKCPDHLPEKDVIKQLRKSHESYSLQNNFLRMQLFFQHRNKILLHKKYRHTQLKRCLHCLKVFFQNHLIMKIPANVIISRTDSIGDVVLSLPLATVLKQHFPNMIIGFMGAKYTQSVIESCAAVDQFIDIEDFLTKEITLAGEKPQCIIHVLPRKNIAQRAAKLNIPQRIGTFNRFFHWLTCNKLVKLSRNKSPLHEAQLNLKLLKPFGIKTDYSFQEIADLYSLTKIPALPPQFEKLLDGNKFKLILHPKSRGSAREWDLNYYAQLINSLDLNKFQIFISGTTNEKLELQPLLDRVANRVTDISGLMNLSEFIAFIAACDGLIACSTGPLHIAAALNKHALGIYPPMHPIHPARWQPIGKKAQVFVLDKNCNACRKDKSVCFCMQAIEPSQLKQALELICQ